MPDEPAGYDVYPEDAGELIRAKALLRRTHKVDCLEPDMQRNVARLEDGSDLNGKGLPTSVALVIADTGALAVQRPRAINNPAMRAYATIRPDLCLDVGAGGALIAETGFVENESRDRLSLCRSILNA
jgi:hypothetical protein